MTPLWRLDDEDFEVAGPRDAVEQLRAFARELIVEGHEQGLDMRQALVCLRDDAGAVFFKGTVAEAADIEVDGQSFGPVQP